MDRPLTGVIFAGFCFAAATAAILYMGVTGESWPISFAGLMILTGLLAAMVQFFGERRRDD